jgi:acyl-CoA reductase-like NAD-dependent aldehyde dehydrogenase
MLISIIFSAILSALLKIKAINPITRGYTMKEYDIIDNVDKLNIAINKMKAAQSIFANFSQEQVDAIFLAAASAANKARIL